MKDLTLVCTKYFKYYLWCATTTNFIYKNYNFIIYIDLDSEDSSE